MLSHKLGLGTVQFGLKYGISNTSGQTTAPEVSRILQYAATQGITVIDTASAYGNAEAVLGENDLSSFSVVSKFITPDSVNTIEAQFYHTLQQLQVKSLYGYLAHRPAEILKEPSQWKKIKDLQQKGLLQKIGFSLNTTDELDALLQKQFIPELIQVPYNYLDNRFENQMLTLKEKGCEIHTRSAFLQGLFFKEVQTLPAFFDVVRPVLKNVQAQTQNLSGALLQFVCSKPFIDKVIIGVETQQQLMDNIAGLNNTVELEPSTIKIPEAVLMPSNWPQA
ncbi:MAG TPA: aldo/keto reductase [Ferruginibacter sp.]|nr:aldo/keto reductase [Ferruginibacter sp.]HMP19661.1 aldo/keto reductase [Ferruginibacter sp.]